MATVIGVERAARMRRAATLPLIGRSSDEALAARTGAGDERAFEELYGRYRDPLHRYCASILRQPEDAEEAFQSAMLGAYRALAHREVATLSVRPWLYRIAHNECIGMLRRRAARPTEPLTGLEAARAQDVADSVETSDELARLRQDILSLPTDQRGALVLRELSGLSHEQIALVLGETPAVVKQLIYQARLGLHAMADGRALGCDTVRRRISDGDGRVLRSRGMGAHLRTCPTCRAFREGLATRPAKLAAMAPVAPLAAGREILAALGLGGGGTSGVASGLSLAGGGLALKLALIATVGVVGTSAVVAPRVIGEPARPSTPAAHAARSTHAVPALAGLATPTAGPRATDPPEADAPLDLGPIPGPPATLTVARAPEAPAPAAVPTPAADAAPASPATPATPATRTTPAPTASRVPVAQPARQGGGAPASRAGGPPADPGNSGNAPGNPGNAPGNSGNAPGNSASGPGDSGEAPGNSGNAPGSSGNAPATPATPATPAAAAQGAPPAAAADASGRGQGDAVHGPKAPPVN